jgi:hypothetical protein
MVLSAISEHISANWLVRHRSGQEGSSQNGLQGSAAMDDSSAAAAAWIAGHQLLPVPLSPRMSTVNHLATALMFSIAA